jgi:hypothetical protein
MLQGEQAVSYAIRVRAMLLVPLIRTSKGDQRHERIIADAVKDGQLCIVTTVAVGIHNNNKSTTDETGVAKKYTSMVERARRQGNQTTTSHVYENYLKMFYELKQLAKRNCHLNTYGMTSPPISMKNIKTAGMFPVAAKGAAWPSFAAALSGFETQAADPDEPPPKTGLE